MTRGGTAQILLLAIYIPIALCAATVAPAAPAGERVMGVAGSVEGISADAGWVAISSHLESGGRVCDRAAAWRPASGAVVRFGRPGQCREDDGSYDDAVVDLHLAGGRTLFTSYSYGNHAYCDAVWTATIGAQTPTRVRNAPCTGGWGDADQRFEIAGSGSLIAVTSFVDCASAACLDEHGNQIPGGSYDIVLWRLSGTRLTRLAAVADRSRLLSAEAGRIALLAPDGTVVLRSASGRLLRTLPFGKREVVDAKLSGGTLVVRTRSSIRILDAKTGSVIRTRTLAPGARVKDVEGELAVYLRGRTIRVLRLSDGRDRAYKTVMGLADVELERAGLSYAYNLRTSTKPGRVVLVPWADLERLLA